MVKKLYTIDVEDKELKTPAKTTASKKTKAVESKEVETFGVVEINNASAVKKVKNKTDKGFEKNVSASPKRTVKAKTSKVDDYFDFSFRKEESKVEPKKAETKVESKKTETKNVESKMVAQEAPVLKMTESAKAETVSEVTKFDSEADQIIRVARLGSLFDIDKRMINAL